jgi:hypothetical protein
MSLIDKPSRSSVNAPQKRSRLDHRPLIGRMQTALRLLGRYLGIENLAA